MRRGGRVGGRVEVAVGARVEVRVRVSRSGLRLGLGVEALAVGHATNDRDPPVGLGGAVEVALHLLHLGRDALVHDDARDARALDGRWVGR